MLTRDEPSHKFLYTPMPTKRTKKMGMFRGVYCHLARKMAVRTVPQCLRTRSARNEEKESHFSQNFKIMVLVLITLP